MALKEMAERKNSPPSAKGENRLKEREAENVLKQLMTAQTAGEGSCLPINEVLVLICHLDCTSELVGRRGRKNKKTRLKRSWRGFGLPLGCADVAGLRRGRGSKGGSWANPAKPQAWRVERTVASSCGLVLAEQLWAMALPSLGMPISRGSHPTTVCWVSWEGER